MMNYSALNLKSQNPLKFLSIIGLLILLPSLAFSQKVGYQIKIKVDDFDKGELYLGYFYGDKQYLKDTAYIEADGKYYFEGNEKLQPGIYMVVLPPDNKFFQLLVNDDEQWFSVETKMEGMESNMKIDGSNDNKLFYDYLNFLGSKRPEADDLKQKIQDAGGDEKKKLKYENQLEAIDAEVLAKQNSLIKNNPKSLTAAVIKSNMPLDIPKFEGEQKEQQAKSFYWMREHWFDNIDLTDPRMVRTPFLFNKIMHYIEKMTVQHPDSIINAVDHVLEKAKPSEETFKYYLIHFLNEYAKSKVVGMDAVYVHLAMKYYKTGQAPWTDAEQLDKILENAGKLEPLLIGKIAPNIQMEFQDGTPIQLHDFRSPLTVLFFWDPECGHCKKSMPEMVEFAKNYKDKGVSVFAICTRLVTRDDEGKFSMEEVDKCWKFISEKDMDVFYNTVDPYHRSRYKTIYDIRSTPQVYVLDEDKTILSKRIGAEQLPEVIDHILKVKGNKIKEGGMEKD